MLSTVRNIWSMLLPPERRTAVVLLVLVLAGTALETLSVGLVLPVLTFMVRGAGPAAPFLDGLFDRLGDPAPDRRILIVLLLLVAVYAVKSAFLVFLAYRQAQFSRTVQASVSRRLFAAYLAQPWTRHLQRNSAEVLRTISESPEFVLVCRLVFLAISEVLLLIGLVGLLLWFEPTGAIIVAGLLVTAGWLFNAIVRPHARRWAQAHRQHTRLVIQQVQQGVGGVKDLKIRGCEEAFLGEFRHHTGQTARTSALLALMQQLPRLFFELLAVVALLLLTAVLVWQGTAPEKLIPVLGLFATAAFRMLPSVNHVTTAVQKLRSSEPMLAGIHAELAAATPLPHRPPATPVRFRDAVVLEDVCFRYPGSRANVLDSINLRIPHGASVGFVGESGAGKSTLIDVILGLLPPSSGCVLVDDADISRNLRGWQDAIGYVPQAIYLCDESIRRNVAFGVPEKDVDDAAVWRALKAAQLDAFVNGLPEGVETSVGERGVRLSGGQRQRIGIARALYHDPQVLVLDEATSALDTETERGVMDAVNSLHGTKTLVIVAHRVTTVSKCDAVYRLDKGRAVRCDAPPHDPATGSAAASQTVPGVRTVGG